MLSASAISSGPEAATRFATSTTRETGISPSNGQPNAAESVTPARMPSRRADSLIASQSSIDWAVGTPWLRWL